jgi:Bacterial RNA polymerase, alpha chain C terminal domain
VASLSKLQLSRRVLGILNQNDITDADDLVALNERELLALHRFGGSSLDEVYGALDEMGLELAEDPYAPYVCAREGKAARDANLANLFLCDDCAAKWQAEAFDGGDPEYVGVAVTGFCVNCNVRRDDVRLRQWLLCGNCERVARSIGRSVVAERYVVDRWNEVIAPHADGLALESTDVPTLRRGPRGASGVKRSAIDFVVRNAKQKPVFGFEMKTGRGHVSGVAPVGPRMGQFQLDVSDCDDITAVMERDDLPVYLLHVQVIDRAHPPTLQYVALAAWWTDVFRMADHFDHVQRRPRENRDAAYFDTSMFDPFDTFASHVASGDYRRIAKPIKRDGIPELYSY